MKTTKHNITNTAEPIKPGYKKTKVGIIPEDWEVKRIKSVADVIGGGTPSTTEVKYWNGNINWFTPSEIKGKFVSKSERKITKAGLKNSSAKELPIGTILLTTRATIGEASLSTEISTTNQGFQSLVCKKGTNNVFLYELIKFNKNELYRRANGSTFLEISGKEVRKIPLAIPPLPEQEAIADCLTTWDKAIEKLSALIASKKEQKKGLMQGLFSGELKVENGELVKVEDEKLWLKGWKEVRLGDLFDYKNGKSLENEIIENGEYNLITLNSIDINGELKKNHHRLNFNDNSLVKNDVIMILSDVAHGNFLGLSAIIPDNSFVLNQRVGRLRLMTEDNVFFIRLVVNFNQRYFKRMGQGSSQQNLSKGDILKFKFNIPSIKEQNAIAEVLTTADKEIELLEKKLESYKTQKKGLMQVLLTGTKRLV